MSTQRNVIMLFHPAQLSEGELQRLAVWCKQIAPEAPALAQWWGQFAATEIMRRSGGDAEPVTLNLDPTAWTNTDLGEAIAATTKITLAARSGDRIGKVLEASALAMALLARERLGMGE